METCPLGFCRAFTATPPTSTGMSLTLRRCCMTRGSWQPRIAERFRYGRGIPLRGGVPQHAECWLGRSGLVWGAASKPVPQDVAHPMGVKWSRTPLHLLVFIQKCCTNP